MIDEVKRSTTTSVVSSADTCPLTVLILTLLRNPPHKAPTTSKSSRKNSEREQKSNSHANVIPSTKAFSTTTVLQVGHAASTSCVFLHVDVIVSLRFTSSFYSMYHTKTEVFTSQSVTQSYTTTHQKGLELRLTNT